MPFKEAVIIANGDFVSKELIKEVTKNKFIIASDGALKRLFRLSIKPHVVIGDFDSLSSTYIKSIDKKISLIKIVDQNKTDLMKAIEFALEKKMKRIYILCALYGTRLDHHESALRNLRKYHDASCIITIETNHQTIRYAKDETIMLQGETGDKCAIFAYPKGKISSTGLVYDVSNYPLNFAHSESISNALAASKAIVTIKGEALIHMPTAFYTQKKKIS